ncbi:hypothetical protein GCM10029992_63370 [Glycomyces albus]
MAEVVADRLAGGEATFPGADLSTKLKLLGVDVAQFGAMEGPLAQTYLDPAGGTYAKLVLSDDAQTLLGGMLVGNAEPYPLLRASVGGKVPGQLADLLSSGEVEGTLPDGAQVCSCNAVTKGEIMGAIGDGCHDVGAIKSCTKAGTSCGSCVPMLKQLLAEGGVEVSKSVCEHFTQSRAELFDIIKVTGITTFSELIARYGSGGGCDLCKPAVASILASLSGGHILEGEQATLQDTNDHFLANLQRNGTYSVVPRIPGGEITPRSSSSSGRSPRTSGSTPRSPAASASTCSAPAWRTCRRSGAGSSTPASSPATPTARPCAPSSPAWAPTGAATASRTRSRWPSTWNCATAACAARTRSSRPSPAAPASAPRPAARTSASSPPRRAGTSTSAATAASHPDTPTCCCPMSTPRRWCGPSTGS